MKNKSIDAYIIASTDPHLGEYVPDHWRIVEWLTGFTGSTAIVVITDSFAGLWTDSRYVIQAGNQLIGSDFVAANLLEKKDYISWVGTNLPDEGKIALDGRLFSIEQTRRLSRSFESKKFSFDLSCDLILDIWKDRPLMPHSSAFDHPVIYCGKERSEKIAEVRKQMKIRNIDFQLLTSPDDIMWLLNIRGNDIKYSPLIISFALVGEEQILLFTDESKIPLKLASEFDRLGIVMLPYEETAGMITTLSSDSAILFDPSGTSAELYQSMPQGIKLIEDINIVSRLKAVKNETEIGNIRNAMIKDGVALTKFFIWLEQRLESEKITELNLSEKIDALRIENDTCLGPSFSSIIAFNEHGALPHYSSTPESASIIGKGILLVDSGGQYLDGTTDITQNYCHRSPYFSTNKRLFSCA